jgi:hypothetical protein
MAEKEPDLYEQTMELGKSLKAISDRDPDGKPSETAAAAFRGWLEAVKGSTTEPPYFEDVSENYDIFGNSNKDLFTIFELLHPYVEFPEPEEEPPTTFIGLPMA